MGAARHAGAASVWGSVVSASNPLPVQTAGAAATIGITPTDRTIASTSGSSQTLMAANASRHSLTIENTGNANCGVNPTGGTASIGAAGTLTLAPLGSYTPRIPTLSAMTVICTAAQPIYAMRTDMTSVGGALKSKIIASTRDLAAVSGSVGYTGMGFSRHLATLRVMRGTAPPNM
jgi:hypothetical protein